MFNHLSTLIGACKWALSGFAPIGEVMDNGMEAADDNFARLQPVALSRLLRFNAWNPRGESCGDCISLLAVRTLEEVPQSPFPGAPCTRTLHPEPPEGRGKVLQRLRRAAEPRPGKKGTEQRRFGLVRFRV